MNHETRRAILDTTEALLGRVGFDEMTAERIARDAGISRASFYLHFRGKGEAALAMVDRIVDRVTGRIEEIASSDRPVARKLTEMLVTRVLIRFDALRDYREGIDELLASIRPSLLARRKNDFARESRIFQRVIEEGIRAGDLTRDDAPRMARALLIGTNALLPHALSARELGDRKKVERDARDVAELLIEGIIKRRRA